MAAATVVLLCRCHFRIQFVEVERSCQKIKENEPPFPPLATVCKKRFPFSLACPSFVYPAGYVDNVRHLAPFVDEIELLFFESRFADSLPVPALIRELAQLSRSGDITYNVHLPTDIYLGTGTRRAPNGGGCADPNHRPLRAAGPHHLYPAPERDHPNPTTGAGRPTHDIAMEAVLTTGISGRRISVENLDYDLNWPPRSPTWILACAWTWATSWHRGATLTTFFDRWRERITMPAPAWCGRRHDHLPLDRLSDALMIRGAGSIETIQRRGFPGGLFFRGAECLVKAHCDEWVKLGPETEDCPAV
jgi:hypothetical protein